MSHDITPVPPEAAVIRLARLALGMTAESAAAASRAHGSGGVSAAYWRDVERGQGGRRGQRVPTRASARALAAMARTVGVTPAELTGAGREDAARVLEEARRREGTAIPLPPAVAPRRDRRLPVLDVDDEEALRPFVLSVRRDLLAAAGFRFGPGREVPDLPEVEEYLASLPGALIFAADHEARVWDYEPMSAQERLRLIAVLRQMGAAARDAAEEPGERNAVLARAT